MKMSSTSCHANGTEYTDVIVIGNGPSAICLSYFLSGHRPYYNGLPHSNPYLHTKLQEIGQTQTIVDQDLDYLSEGLEGRTTNPVALLFDALVHPDADMGAEIPSLLDWKKEEEHAFRHIVLGRGKVGGAWQKMDGSMQTLSLGNWMELPSVPLKEWRDRKFREGESLDPCSNRATISDVRNYYMDYVANLDLQNHFYDHHTVTSIQKVYQVRNGMDLESGEVEPCCNDIAKNHTYLWEVRGYISSADQSFEDEEDVHRREFCIQAPHVVVATGTFDIPNTLNISGEFLPHVIHSLHDFESALKSWNEIPRSTDDPVLIVGAGLSAADAILMALNANLPVIHVFRRGANDSNLIFKKLPQGLYPEYHRIHSLMKGKVVDPLYRPYEKHRLVQIDEDKRVLLENTKGNDITTVDVTIAVILIGSRPNLSFLPEEGRSLGVDPQHQINSKNNTLDVDLFSYESVKHKGLFSMGPLVGDNFVRFGIGGALGVTNYLVKNRKKGNPCC